MINLLLYITHYDNNMLAIETWGYKNLHNNIGFHEKIVLNILNEI